MQNEIDPQIQTLLDELTTDSYLVRQKAIVKSLEPHFDIVIPRLIKRMKDKSDNYHIRHNAIEVLALSADPRSILPVIRHIEIESGWTRTVFDYLRQGLQEKDNNTRQNVNQQLIRYLEEGPKIPALDPFNPVAQEKSFDDFIDALMKKSGVTEMDNETQKLAGEVKQRWMQPPDTTEEEKQKVRNIQEILVEVIETLSEFDGLKDPRVGVLLSKSIRDDGFHSFASQHALTALSKIEPSLAITHLNELATASAPPQDTTIKRVVHRKPDDNVPSYQFTICLREPDAEKWDERVYYFVYEQGLIFLFARAPIIEKWFVGQAFAQDQAVQVAVNYLGRWRQTIDSLARIADRYSECIHVVQQFLDFEKWGFQQTSLWQVYDHPTERPQIIYDSPWCRVKVSFRSYGEMHDQSDVLSILYGRSHAADREETILWKGEPHYCWHHASLALCFLDGMPPGDTANVLWDHPVIAKYKASNSGPQPAIEAGMHAAIWEYYGERLFQLFDLQRPDLWDKFSVFVKQVYEIKGWKHYGHMVPHEKIC